MPLIFGGAEQSVQWADEPKAKPQRGSIKQGFNIATNMPEGMTLTNSNNYKALNFKGAVRLQPIFGDIPRFIRGFHRVKSVAIFND